MTDLHQLTESVLETHYSEVIDTLEKTDYNYPKASNLSTTDISTEEMGRVLTYLARNDLIDFYKERPSGPSTYDLTDFKKDEVEKFLREDFDLD